MPRGIKGALQRWVPLAFFIFRKQEIEELVKGGEEVQSAELQPLIGYGQYSRKSTV